MKYEVSKNPSKTVDIRSIQIHLPIYDTDGVPSCLLDVEGNLHFEVELDTGKVLGWDCHDSVSLSLEANDFGEHVLTVYDEENRNMRYVFHFDYPPRFLIHSHEYVACCNPDIFQVVIGDDGVLKNWNKIPDCFFN